MSQIPAKFKKYFWDVGLANVDLSKHQAYVIERLLEYGNEVALRWLFSNYSKEDILQTLKSSRNLSAKSANFWANIYNIPKEEIKCLKNRSVRPQEVAWPY